MCATGWSWHGTYDLRLPRNRFVGIETVDDGEEKFFGLIADDPHPKYQDVRKYIVVADTGVGWRSSPRYGDRAAGQGPARGTMVETPAVSPPHTVIRQVVRRSRTVTLTLSEKKSRLTITCLTCTIPRARQPPIAGDYVEGFQIWFIKAQVSPGVYLFLPINGPKDIAVLRCVVWCAAFPTKKHRSKEMREWMLLS